MKTYHAVFHCWSDVGAVECWALLAQRCCGHAAADAGVLNLEPCKPQHADECSMHERVLKHTPSCVYSASDETMGQHARFSLNTIRDVTCLGAGGGDGACCKGCAKEPAMDSRLGKVSHKSLH